MTIMKRDLAAMARQEYDILVVGGGIIGCGIARDAADRGLRVALVEKEDFAYGTTSRSTRLIHGGLRYLELFDFALVHEALHERETLLRIAPHLVHGLPFVTPIYRGDRWSPLMVKAGMLLYDLLSLGKSLPSHRMLSPRQVCELEPGLKAEGLRGGALYYDGQVEYPERLCIENLQSAREQGAVFANYAMAKSLQREGTKVTGAVVEDRLTGQEHLLRARLVLNAAGPWADTVANLGLPKTEPRLRRTKGIHLVTPSFTKHAVVLLAKRDGRVFFAVPWAGHTLVGTTDTDFEQDPGAVTTEEADVRYLIEETQRAFPQAEVGNVHYTFAGVRPLVRSRKVSESAVSRKHRVVDHTADGAPGLISVFGGKITSYRAIAAEAVDVAARQLGNTQPCRTAVTPLYGGGETPEALRPRIREQAAALGLDEEQADHLISLYGVRAESILALAAADAELRERIAPAYPDIRAQIRYAAQEEMARSAADFLLRRTGIGYTANQGEDALATVSRTLGALLGWNNEQERADQKAYAAQLAHDHAIC